MHRVPLKRYYFTFAVFLRSLYPYENCGFDFFKLTFKFKKRTLLVGFFIKSSIKTSSTRLEAGEI